MPHETRIRREFGDRVHEIVSPDSYGKAAIKTGISQAYLLSMRRGKVPSREIIERFAIGYKADPQPLLIAAGYAEPASTPEAVRVIVRHREPELSEEALAKVEEVIADILKQYGGKEKQ